LVGQQLFSDGKLKGVISVCGVDPKRDGDKLTLPSFHIIGKTDSLRERSIKLYDTFSGTKELVEHEAGHKFPSSKETDIAKKLKKFLDGL